ncbi:MAG: DUF4159 domain-containing protein [Parvularculaceae bacterium]|nr:DUF4159 domain-containing protein [Parvularculaceae bacterium]
MGALSFVSPLILVALAALPAVWFVLRATPPSPRKVRFPAFDLLRRLARTRETPERTPWWVLLMRLLIAGLAILGLAGPVLNAPPAPQSGGPLILVVDNSWAAAANWRLRTDAARRVAEQAVAANRQAYLIETVSDAEAAPVSGEELLRAAANMTPEPFAPDYARVIERFGALAGKVEDAQIVWLSDGVAHAGADALLAAMRRFGSVSIAIDAAGAPVLYPPRRTETTLSYPVLNIADAGWSGDLVGLARDGRELARAHVEIAAGEKIDAALDLPLALQNELAQARLQAVSSSAAVQLADARERRALIGIVDTGEKGRDPLLAGAHYIRKALAPYAVFLTDTLDNLLSSDASVIVLDDIGVLRAADADRLQAWAEKGGVVIRFAGPTLAEAAGAGTPALLPVALRGGGRAFGGALTWETPQPLGGFSPDGPFADLASPKDVFIRRQVLAEPGGEATERSWASLADGTPLVTGASAGAGAIALFHVTATPDWSDLPLSTLFVEMLRKLTFISSLGPKALGEESAQRAAPFRVLDGFGALRQPPRDIAPSTLAEIAQGAAPGRPPGLYGAPEAPIALNTIRAGDEFARFDPAGADRMSYSAPAPMRIAPTLFLIALALLIADALVALRLAGRLPFFALVALAGVVAGSPRALAQPLDRPIESKTEAAALSFRLAYVRTGDPSIDRISQAGLTGLSREITRRTSAEPDAPTAVDLETDDLSVYPFLYWPIAPGAGAPSETALANIENFIRFGGLILFDTRDDERAVDGAITPEGEALRAILYNLDLPPLTPVSGEHVLLRSFYLLSDLRGRAAERPIWVQSGDGPNDSVTPVIIGGRDWAGAWATGDAGEPLLPVSGPARACAEAEGGVPRSARECALRAGVNIVMVALTGNYKSDQVHTPVLLERLGRR